MGQTQNSDDSAKAASGEMIERKGRGGSYNSMQDYSENQKSKQFHASSYSSIN